MKLNRYYQGLPNSGYDGVIVKLVKIFEDNGIIFYEFDNEEICNEEFIAPFTLNIEDVKGKFFVELASEKDIWEIMPIKNKKNIDKDTTRENGSMDIEIPPYEDISTMSNSNIIITNNGRVKIVPPTPNCKYIPPVNYSDYMESAKKNEEVIAPEKVIEKESHIEVEKIEEVKEEPVSIIKKEVEIEKENVLLDNDPVTILVNTSKKNDTIIPMQMTISLPTKELFNIVSNNFDNGDEKFVDVILSQINYDMFKVCLRDALLQAYKYEEEKIID